MTAEPISERSTEEFYDELASSYNDIIYRCAPRYDEMQMTMVDYVPNDLQPLRILDLGCGTGNLTLRVLEAFPEAEVVALDLSAEILDVCRRQCGTDRVSYLQQDFYSLDLPDAEFDLVVSSIAIHHVDDPAKQRLFNDVYASYVPTGCLRLSISSVVKLRESIDDTWKSGSCSRTRKEFQLKNGKCGWNISSSMTITPR